MSRTHAAGRNTAKPTLIEEMKSTNFKPKKLDESSDLSAIEEGSIEAGSLNERKESETPQPELLPAPEQQGDANSVEPDQCICSDVTQNKVTNFCNCLDVS